MNKLLAFFCVIFLSASLYSEVAAQPVTIEKVREQFFTMNETRDGALKLFTSLEKSALDKNPVLMAYRGASSATAAGSASGVRQKLDFFKRGKEELETAVGLKPLDAEIRFLRLATQVKAPSFLGYNSDIKNDKAIILKTLQSVPANHPNAYLYQQICSFLLLQVELEPAEKTTVNQLIVKFNTKVK